MRDLLMRRRLAQWSRGALITLICTVLAAPLVAIVLGALHSPGDVPAPGDLWPWPPSLASLQAAFSTIPLASGLWNSFLISLGFVVVAVPLAAACGFALRFFSPAWRWSSYGLLVLAASVPDATTWLPRFLAYQWLGIADSWWPLWIPAIAGGSPLLVLLFAVAFARLRLSPLLAARLEGLPWWRIFVLLAWPQVRPATWAAGILAAAMSWANFAHTLLYLQSQEEQTAPTLIHSLSLLGASYWPVLMASALLVALPVLLLIAALPVILDHALEDQP
nr:carbohydrate ABC transporter permease [Oceanococcus sp. HetDA_MAG_MS8]